MNPLQQRRHLTKTATGTSFSMESAAAIVSSFADPMMVAGFLKDGEKARAVRVTS
jgi:hypothetical protein